MSWKHWLPSVKYGSTEYPELDFFQDEEDRQKVLRAHGRRAGWLSGLIVTPLAFLFYWVPGRLMHPLIIKLWPAAPLMLSTFLFGALIGLVLGYAGKELYGRRALQRHLRRELCKRGIPVCMSCGYNVTGNASGICPECGTPV